MEEQDQMKAWLEYFIVLAHTSAEAPSALLRGTGIWLLGCSQLPAKLREARANTNSFFSTSNVAESQGLRIYCFNEAAHFPSNLSPSKSTFAN